MYHRSIKMYHDDNVTDVNVMYARRLTLLVLLDSAGAILAPQQARQALPPLLYILRVELWLMVSRVLNN